ncbi:MAG: phenylacetic acid degradation operon negative regulatory protein PaaX [Pseudomonadota bacterium]
MPAPAESPIAAPLEPLIHDFRAQRPIRAGSLIVTVFGDTISRHDNCVWLGSLISALAPLGLNQRLVRTSVYRLSQDGWLESEQVGRRSFYRFTPKGLSSYRKAARRIYNLDPKPWDDQWTLVLAGFLSDRERDALRRELQWLGFGTLTPGMMAHPSHDRDALDETLSEMNLASKVTVLSARTEDLTSREVLKKLAVKSWKLKDLGENYRQFVQRFSPALKWLEDGQTLRPDETFLLRTLLIHEYRRLLLRDADLPDELLDERWPGRDALALTAGLYRRLRQPSADYLCRHLEGMEGPLPPPDEQFFRRFPTARGDQHQAGSAN